MPMARYSPRTRATATVQIVLAESREDALAGSVAIPTRPSARSPLLESFSKRKLTASVWQDGDPVWAELFGGERLEDHARSLARAQRIEPGSPRSEELLVRLDDNDRALRATYQETAKALQAGRPIAPAAEWLIDNYHAVEK